jgi:ArsR family transcriptional regulator
MISPKAVIEHLQMMEREEILCFRLDERRRKYYYLTNDISVMVNLNRLNGMTPASDNANLRFRKPVNILS